MTEMEDIHNELKEERAWLPFESIRKQIEAHNKAPELAMLSGSECLEVIVDNYLKAISLGLGDGNHLNLKDLRSRLLNAAFHVDKD